MMSGMLLIILARRYHVSTYAIWTAFNAGFSRRQWQALSLFFVVYRGDGVPLP